MKTRGLSIVTDQDAKERIAMLEKCIVGVEYTLMLKARKRTRYTVLFNFDTGRFTLIEGFVHGYKMFKDPDRFAQAVNRWRVLRDKRLANGR